MDYVSYEAYFFQLGYYKYRSSKFCFFCSDKFLIFDCMNMAIFTCEL